MNGAEKYTSVKFEPTFIRSHSNCISIFEKKAFPSNFVFEGKVEVGFSRKTGKTIHLYPLSGKLGIQKGADFRIAVLKSSFVLLDNSPLSLNSEISDFEFILKSMNRVDDFVHLSTVILSSKYSLKPSGG
jgi:hypothetical protein